MTILKIFLCSQDENRQEQNLSLSLIHTPKKAYMLESNSFTCVDKSCYFIRQSKGSHIKNPAYIF